MMSMNDAVVIAKDKIDQGLMNTDQANVYIVQLLGVRIVTKLDRATRQALNNAVKIGELGHIKKDGLKPEVYHHKNSRGRAIEIRNKIALESVEKIKSVCCAS